MEEEKRVQNEFVFVNRNAGLGRSELVEEEEKRIPKKTHSERKPISLEGEAFVAVFQTAVCVLLLLIFVLINSHGGAAAQRLSDGYRNVTNAQRLDIPAYFAPIPIEENAESTLME